MINSIAEWLCQTRLHLKLIDPSLINSYNALHECGIIFFHDSFVEENSTLSKRLKQGRILSSKCPRKSSCYHHFLHIFKVFKVSERRYLLKNLSNFVLFQCSKQRWKYSTLCSLWCMFSFRPTILLFHADEQELPGRNVDL